jgi:hypothetical protein
LDKTVVSPLNATSIYCESCEVLTIETHYDIDLTIIYLRSYHEISITGYTGDFSTAPTNAFCNFLFDSSLIYILGTNPLC